MSADAAFKDRGGGTARRLLLKGGYLLDPLDPSLEFARSDILIRGDTISEIGDCPSAAADQVIDLSGKVVMPGLISAHSHASTLLDRGLVDNLPLEPWLLQTVMTGGDVNPRECYAATALSATEFLRSGTSALLDHLPTGLLQREEHLDAMIQAYIDVGLRVVVAPSYADLAFSQSLPLHLLGAGVDPSPLDSRPAPSATEILREAQRFLERWLHRHERITPALGPSNPVRLSDGLMRETVELARQYGVSIHSHLLESRLQAVVSRERWGSSVGPFLKNVGCLGPHVSFAHAVWVNEADIRVLADSGSSVVHNPPANMRLGSGIAPLHAMRRSGLNVALGADGPGGNDSQNMFEVMKYAALMHKLYGPPSAWLSARDAMAMCVNGGSKALRQNVGTLKPGSLADLTILTLDRLFLMPKEHFVTQIVYSESGASVDTVLVGGQVVVEGGVVRTVSITDLKREVQATIGRVYAELGARRRSFRGATSIIDQLMEAAGRETLPYSRYAAL